MLGGVFLVLPVSLHGLLLQLERALVSGCLQGVSSRRLRVLRLCLTLTRQPDPVARGFGALFRGSLALARGILLLLGRKGRPGLWRLLHRECRVPLA
jgi:hypothetical protein